MKLVPAKPNEWQDFLGDRDPSPTLVIEFLESMPELDWGYALNWLLLDHEYRTARLEERIDRLEQLSQVQE